MASKLCDSCKSAAATLYCRADAAFLCVGCDAEVHAANKLASRHARVWVCEVCEQAPAHVTCKADAAALCLTCDRDIHSANPLAGRHDRVPVVPLYDPPACRPSAVGLFSDAEEAEAEAASWLLPNPKASAAAAAAEMEPYLDLDYSGADLKLDSQDQHSSGTADGVVPVVTAKIAPPENCFDLDFSSPSKPFLYAFGNPAQSLSSSSLDVGVVPDGDTAAKQAVPMSAADREARVLRYREKRKNRKFEKTIRYASRKAYAETRPRIKGRFAKRTEVDLQPDRISGYGVVPTF